MRRLSVAIPEVTPVTCNAPYTIAVPPLQVLKISLPPPINESSPYAALPIPVVLSPLKP